jgi:hypothetical protein
LSTGFAGSCNVVVSTERVGCNSQRRVENG